MKKQKIDKQYDHIVIGGGIGGLTAGALLAKKKKKVLLLERYNIIGGCGQYFERKGYRFDVSLHQIGSVEHGTVNDILRKTGVYDRLEFIKLKDLYISHFRNKDLKVELPNGDIKKLRQILIELFPNEKKGIDTWLWWVKFLGKQIQMWDDRIKNPVRRVLSEFFAPVIFPGAVFSNLFSYKVALRHIKDQYLYKIVNQLWGYYGLPASQCNMQFNAVANYGYYIHGGYYLKGGGYEMCTQMKNVIEENGGKVLVNANVKKIHTLDNKAVGVQLENKSNYFAKHIFSNANPIATYNMLKEHPKIAETICKVNSKEVSMSCSVLYLGLKKSIGEINPALKDKYEIFLNPDNVTEEQEYEQYKMGAPVTLSGEKCNKTLAITMHSNIDPSQNSKDKSVLNVFLADNYDRWGNLSRKEYIDQKEEETEQILDTLECYLPDIRQYIEVSEFATPVTVQRFTNNHKGAIYGYSQHIKQGGLKRLGMVSSKIKNLHFCSAWGFPGGGYEGSMRGAFYSVHSVLSNKVKYYATWVIWLTIFIGFQIWKAI